MKFKYKEDCLELQKLFPKYQKAYLQIPSSCYFNTQLPIIKLKTVSIKTHGLLTHSWRNLKSI